MVQAGRNTGTLASAAGMILVLFAYGLSISGLWHQLNDDAFITLRYSLNLASGRGPYYNPGEHVEGYTNFLTMALLAGYTRLAGAATAPLAAKLLSAVAGALVVLVAMGLVWRMTQYKLPAANRAWLALGTGLLAATNAAFAVNATTGLETTLFTLLLLAGTWLALEEQQRVRTLGAALAFSLLVLARPEGPAYFAVVWLALVWPTALALARGMGPRHPQLRARLRMHLTNLGIVTAVFLAHLGFRILAYDGELLPNTYYAKAGGFSMCRPSVYILDHIRHCYGGVLPLTAGLAGLLACAWRRQCIGAVLAPAVLGLVLPLFTGSDWMEGWRLLVPVYPLWIILMVLGFAGVQSRWQLRRWYHAAVPMATAAAALSWVQADDRAWFHELVGMRAIGYLTGHLALADWLTADAAQRGFSSVALMDIGMVGFHCPELTVIDITGLTDREIAKSDGGFLGKQNVAGYVFGRRPDYIVLTKVAHGDPYKPVLAPASLRTFPIDKAIERHPEFARRYVGQATASPGDGGFYESLAGSMGAVRVFEHGVPDNRYFLCVYRRSDASADTQLPTP